MRKKGIQISLKAIIGLVLAAIIIIPTIVLFTGLYNMVYGGPDQGTKEKFNELGQAIEELISNNESKTAKSISYYLPKGFILVGFDAKWNDFKIVSECGVYYDEAVAKPRKCGNKACICLYKDTPNRDLGSDESKNPSLECKTFNKSTVIYGIFKEEEPGNVGLERKDIPLDVSKGINPAYYILYGQCDELGSDPHFKVKQIYIEKIKKNNVNYIFIAKISDKIKKRAQDLKIEIKGLYEAE